MADDKPLLVDPEGRPISCTDEQMGQGLLLVGRQLAAQIPKDITFCVVMTRNLNDGKTLYFGNKPASELRRLLYKAREEMQQGRAKLVLQG